MNAPTSYSTNVMRPAPGLPDPDREADFYAGVPFKRLLAWVVDVLATTILTVLAIPLTLFTGIFYLPLLYAVIGFLYRWVSLTRLSATLGMTL